MRTKASALRLSIFTKSRFKSKLAALPLNPYCSGPFWFARVQQFLRDAPPTLYWGTMTQLALAKGCSAECGVASHWAASAKLAFTPQGSPG